MEKENELTKVIQEVLGKDMSIDSKEFVSCALLFVLSNVDKNNLIN